MTSHRTPLMDACRKGDKQKVADLLRRGHDPNAQNANGTTPFMYAKTSAFGSGDLTIMKALLAAGADTSKTDKFGKTALDYARENFAKIEAFILENTP